MSELKLKSGTSAVTAVLVNQDAGAASYRFRSDLWTVDAIIRHIKLSNKGVRGSRMFRHSVELNIRQFATTTDLGHNTKATFSFEAEESAALADIAHLCKMVSMFASKDAVISALNNSQVLGIDAS